MALPDDRRAEGFFRLWTAKEAYVKARGDGLEHPSSRYTMSLAVGQEGALLVDELSPEAPAHWTVQALPVDGGYVASLATAGNRPRVVMHAWHAAALDI
jgi:4'-phosphopantetheinyl transferase